MFSKDQVKTVSSFVELVSSRIELGTATAIRACISVKPHMVPRTRARIGLVCYDKNGQEIVSRQCFRTATLRIHRIDFRLHQFVGDVEGQEEEWAKAATAVSVDNRNLAYGRAFPALSAMAIGRDSQGEPVTHHFGVAFDLGRLNGAFQPIDASTGIITLNDAAWTHFLTHVLPTLDVATGAFDVAVHRAFENYIYLDHLSSAPKDFVVVDKIYRTCTAEEWLAGRWDPATQLRPGTASVAWVLLNHSYKGVRPEGNYSQPFEWCDESITLQDHQVQPLINSNSPLADVETPNAPERTLIVRDPYAIDLVGQPCQAFLSYGPFNDQIRASGLAKFHVLNQTGGAAGPMVIGQTVIAVNEKQLNKTHVLRARFQLSFTATSATQAIPYAFLVRMIVDGVPSVAFYLPWGSCDPSAVTQLFAVELVSLNAIGAGEHSVSFELIVDSQAAPIPDLEITMNRNGQGQGINNCYFELASATL